LIIGESDYWEQKIGEEVTKLIIEYAFNELNLFNLKAGINSANIGSWRCAEKNGFTRVATFKKGCYVDGKYYDEYRYSLFKEDWIDFKNKEENKEKKKSFLISHYPPASGGKIATISPFLTKVSLFWCGAPFIRIINFVSLEILNISNIVPTVLPKGNAITFFGGAILLKLAKNFTVATTSS
jgi:hypothetical protein